MRSFSLMIALSLQLMSVSIEAQTVSIEGYVFESDNKGFLQSAEVTILENDKVVKTTATDFDGYFKMEVPTDRSYSLLVRKDLFFEFEKTISTQGKSAGDKLYQKIKLDRQPGYIFDVTLAESNDAEAVVNSIPGARIEIFNNTTQDEALVIEAHPYPAFNFTFERGNHYTIMFRKEGYFNKRIEAYVNIEGCILCFDGVGSAFPDITDVLTKGHDLGTLLANVELEPLALNKVIQIENIYYDYDESYIRDDASVELDKLVAVLKDNPVIIVELGSHTDSRGRDSYNLSLSDKRAKAAMEYLIANGIAASRVTYKGYGESALVNQCQNGIRCSDEEHQLNRRTELKIVGFETFDPFQNKSLKQIIQSEKSYEEVMQSSVIKIKK